MTITVYFEDTPRLWAAHCDPEGPIGHGKTKLDAIYELLWSDDPGVVKRLAEEVLELVTANEEAEAITKRYAAYISPEEHAMAMAARTEGVR